MMDIKRIFEMDLRGHDYLRARGLNPQIVKERQHQCETCKQQEMLPAVLNIIDSYRQVGVI